jgi:hypothetical protein
LRCAPSVVFDTQSFTYLVKKLKLWRHRSSFFGLTRKVKVCMLVKMQA